MSRSNYQGVRETDAEVRTETLEVVAHEANRAVRGPISAKSKQDYPGYAADEQKTTRTIPVVIFAPVS